VLLDEEEPAEEGVELSSEPDLAEGSDVHDVDELERKLDAEQIDAVLRDYLKP
jgi:hypothetical protein